MANNRIQNAIGEIIGIADILMAETAANANTPNQLKGSITVNLGSAESGEMQSAEAEVWGSPGIISVPALPDKTANNTDSAQCLYFSRNNQNIVFAVRDTRTMSRAGNITPGETCVYAPNGKGRVLLKKNDAVTLVTEDADGGNITFTISPTGMYFKSPFGKMTFDATGFHVANATGARIDLSAIGAPGPLASVIGSSCTIAASSVSINSGTINLGPSMGAFLPAIYGVTPVVSPGIPVLGAGVGMVVVAACSSTHVNVGI